VNFRVILFFLSWVSLIRAQTLLSDSLSPACRYGREFFRKHLPEKFDINDFEFYSDAHENHGYFGSTDINAQVSLATKRLDGVNVRISSLLHLIIDYFLSGRSDDFVFSTSARQSPYIVTFSLPSECLRDVIHAMLSHEIGHVVLGHVGVIKSPIDAQMCECDADDFVSLEYLFGLVMVNLIWKYQFMYVDIHCKKHRLPTACQDNPTLYVIDNFVQCYNDYYYGEADHPPYTVRITRLCERLYQAGIQQRSKKVGARVTVYDKRSCMSQELSLIP